MNNLGKDNQSRVSGGETDRSKGKKTNSRDNSPNRTHSPRNNLLNIHKSPEGGINTNRSDNVNVEYKHSPNKEEDGDQIENDEEV